VASTAMVAEDSGIERTQNSPFLKEVRNMKEDI
jgi:hypothetical protein